jgi:hypothetical protein
MLIYLFIWGKIITFALGKTNYFFIKKIIFNYFMFLLACESREEFFIIAYPS